jgi:hypothetical protein
MNRQTIETDLPSEEKPRRQLFTVRNFAIAFIVALALGIPISLCTMSLVFRVQCTLASDTAAETAVRNYFGSQPVEIESTECLPPQINYGFNLNRRTEPAFCIITDEPLTGTTSRGQTTHFYVTSRFTFNSQYQVEPVYSSSTWDERGCDDW